MTDNLMTAPPKLEPFKESEPLILTYRFRVKDRHASRLKAMARAVNYVWNFCGETQEHARRWSKRWPSEFDLKKLAAGAAAELGISWGTVEAVCTQFVASRKASRRRPRWRGRKSLGWVPFRSGVVRVDGDAAIYSGQRFRFWNSRLVSGKVRGGSFSRDASGRWYINLQVEVARADKRTGVAVGIDLGLKTLATLSDGGKIENPRHFSSWASKLATAQRAGRKRRAQAIHRKIMNARRHHLHVASTEIVRRYAKIVVGNVNSAGLGRTRMAKSVSDAGWSFFRSCLAYKAIAHGAEYEERDERLSTQTCSDCGSIGGPKGRKGLVVREWKCGDCGAVHDRDVNAARNILGPECRPPRAGTAI